MKIVLFFLLLALACYGFGFAVGGTALLVAGMVFEVVFWCRLLLGRRPR